MLDEQLAAFDEKGELLPHGVSRTQVHHQGIWHRSVSIFVLNRYGEILLEKRSLHKDLFPGLFDIPGGHVKFGQSPKEAAREELKEELGHALTSQLVPLSDEDALIERAVIPEKSIVNLERKTVYLVEIGERDEAAILDYAAKLARLTARELEGQGVFGEVSRIEFWGWERVHEALRTRDTRLLASGTESALSDGRVRDRLFGKCLELRKARRRAFGEIEDNPLRIHDWDSVGDEALLGAVLKSPDEPAPSDLVGSVFEDGVHQTAGAYQLGPFRLFIAGDEEWGAKLDDPWTRYVENLLSAAAYGRDTETRRKVLDAKTKIQPFVRDLLNFPLQNGSRLRDGLGNLADIAVAREAVLLWLRHNMKDVLPKEDLIHPARAVTEACLKAGQQLLARWLETAPADSLTRLRELVQLGLSASAADFNNPRFQDELSRKTSPGPWIFDFLQRQRAEKLCTELGGERFLEEFFDTYLKQKRPATIVFFPGNSGQAYISLAICQELLERNWSFRIVFITKSGSPGTDLSFEDAWHTMESESGGMLAELAKHARAARFVIRAGPAGHGLDPARLAQDTAEALAKADAVWAEGQAYAEIRGWKKPAYIAFRVNGRVAEAIHGVSRARGACGFVKLTPGLDHFQGFEEAMRRRITDSSTGLQIPAAAQTTSEYVTAILGENFRSITDGLFHGDRQEACRLLRSEARRLNKTFADVVTGAAASPPHAATVRDYFEERDCTVFACGGGGGFNGVTLKALQMLGIATAAGVPSTDDGGSSGEIQRELRSRRGFVFGVGDMAGILQESLSNQGKQAVLAYRLDREPDDLVGAVLERISNELKQPTYPESSIGAAPDFLSFVAGQLNLARTIDRAFRKDKSDPLRVKGMSIRNLNLIAAYELCGSLGGVHSPGDAGRMGALYVLFQILGLHTAPIVLPVTYDECTLFLEYGEPVTEELAQSFGIPAEALEQGRRLYGQRYIDKLPQPGVRRTCGVVANAHERSVRPKANPEYLDRLRRAKLFIMGAGSLFGSQLAQLAVPGVVDILLESYDMRRLLVINHVRMDETMGMNLADHIRVIETVANESASPDVVKRVAPVRKRLRISDVFTDVVVPRTVAKEVESEMVRCGYQWDTDRDQHPEFVELQSEPAKGAAVKVFRNRYVDFLLEHPEIVQRLQITRREIEVLSYLDQPLGLYAGRSEAGRYRGALFASDQDIQYILDQGVQSRNIHQIDSIGENWKLAKSEGSPKFEFFPGLVPEALLGIIRISLERGRM
jgi:2-phospho-L-lactate transferase/gluconeogenesis factor (CofD/UPF0052 family)/8-oxo-dGTP pyrophosphatase MutT (NUDIX family)